MRKILIGLLGYTFVSQQMLAQTDSVADTRELKAVVVKATNGIKSRFRVDNSEIIGQGQLIRAACCNLGESFTANPSVDVSYSDAATGAKQIKLLGLSGKICDEDERRDCEYEAKKCSFCVLRHFRLLLFYVYFLINIQ